MGWREIVADVLKSRMTATLLGLLAGYLALQLDLPKEELIASLGSITALVGAYIVQRGISKAKEIVAKNGAKKTP